MNKSKAPKLDPQKILQAISVLEPDIGSSEPDMTLMFLKTSSSENAYKKTRLYSVYRKTKSTLMKMGIYKYFQPINNVLKKIVGTFERRS